MIRDWLSWMRFLGIDLGAPTPDENTIRHFPNQIIETGTLKRVMKTFDWQLGKKGYVPMSGQIVDASLVPAPKQRNTEDEKDAIRASKPAKEIWPDEPNKAVQKDVDARWNEEGQKTVWGTVFPTNEDRRQGPPSARRHATADDRDAGLRLQEPYISIDRRFGFIREAVLTSASAPNGRRIRRVVSRENTGSQVWADSAYRSWTPALTSEASHAVMFRREHFGIRSRTEVL